MKKKILKDLYFALGLFFAFVVWTLLLSFVDIKTLGPNGSCVGFAFINKPFHEFTGVHFSLYMITDWLGLVAIAFMLTFAVLGLCQWIKRRNILKVDFSILALGVFYLVLLGLYLLFEEYPVNYRPVLINNFLEASYPSSTTLLIMTVIPTTILQFNLRIKNALLKKTISASLWIFCAFMVIGRLVSGVHWLSDIIGGGLLSLGLVLMYRFFVGLKESI